MRLFLAAEVPEAQKASLAKALQPARLLLPEAKWTGLESWHVTLKFLGEVPEDKVRKVEKLVAESVEDYQPISSHLTNIGVFPNQRRPRVLWVGLADESSSIMNLGALLEAGFAKQGFRKEERPVRPHLTLARFKEPRADPGKVLKTVEGLRGAELDRSEFQISELVLFESHLSPKGARYQALRRFPVGEP